MRFKVSRDQISWYPTVDDGRCIGCKACFEFCSHGTYVWNEAVGKPEVKNPNSCVVGCSSCALQCPAEAIRFPPLSILRQYM